MKKAIIMIIFLFLAPISWAEDYIDVVYLKNGSVIKGIIIEQIPGQTIKIKTSDGSIYVTQVQDITKIAKEEAQKSLAFTIEKTFGSIRIQTDKGGDIFIDGTAVGTLPAGKVAKLDNVETGKHMIMIRYSDGKNEIKEIVVAENKIAEISFYPQETSGDFVMVKAGSFQMGLGAQETDERPVHAVTISRGFYISRYEVTFDEYDAFCTATGKTKPRDRGRGRENRPVIFVSWYDAIEFCNWLSKKDNLNPCYSGRGDSCDFSASGYRLPTEAEWEYAARGGLKSKDYEYSGSNNPDEIGWHVGISKGEAQVGQKNPNELGLYDMSGNVWEWCWDWYDRDYYRSAVPYDPQGVLKGQRKVARGGSWDEAFYYSRCAERSPFSQWLGYYNVGLRIVRTAE